MGKVSVDRPYHLFYQPLTESRYIDIKTGRRSDTAHNYVYNQSHNANLTVQDKSRVIRVIFEYGPPSLIQFPHFSLILPKKSSGCGRRVYQRRRRSFSST